MLDAGADQAHGLRLQQPAAPALSLMAFPVAAGDSAGWIVQLAHTLRALGARPVVVDATRGGLLTRAFGLRPRHELMDLLSGEVNFDTAAQATPDGVWVLRADRGVEAFVASGAPAHQLFSAFTRLGHGFDALLLAMPPDELACLAPPLRATPVVEMRCDEDGLVRTYSTIKQLAKGFGYSRFALVTRGAAASLRTAAQARITAAARTYLNADVSLAGWLPDEGSRRPQHMVHVAGNLLAAATPLLSH